MPLLGVMPILEDQLAEKVREWVRRVGPTLENKYNAATLKIILCDFGWDGIQPSLTARIEEKSFHDDIEGELRSEP